MSSGRGSAVCWAGGLLLLALLPAALGVAGSVVGADGLDGAEALHLVALPLLAELVGSLLAGLGLFGLAGAERRQDLGLEHDAFGFERLVSQALFELLGFARFVPLLAAVDAQAQVTRELGGREVLLATRTARDPEVEAAGAEALFAREVGRPHVDGLAATAGLALLLEPIEFFDLVHELLRLLPFGMAGEAVLVLAELRLEPGTAPRRGAEVLLALLAALGAAHEVGRDPSPIGAGGAEGARAVVHPRLGRLGLERGLLFGQDALEVGDAEVCVGGTCHVHKASYGR